MPNNQHQIDLISHCIQFMSNMDVIRPFLIQHGIKAPKSYTYEELAHSYESNPNAFTVKDVCSLFREAWHPCNVGRYVDHLSSGLLAGHDWHKAMPSNLHLSFQNKVRDCGAGRLALEEYLKVGTDIAKHEYFMVATHDICESSIILNNPSAIPSIGHKSLSDFVFNDIPYDLKVTTHKPNWKPFAGIMNLEQKKELAVELFDGADTERMRKDAVKCRNNWGLNRMYYVVNDQDKWLQDPKGTVRYLLDNLHVTSNFFDIEVQGFRVHICLIEQ